MTSRHLASFRLAPAALILIAALTTPAYSAGYAIDPVHSSVVFKAKHFGASNFYGNFNTITGTILFDEANPTASSISLEIPTAGIYTRNENRDNHLKSPDFFNVAQFPTVSFMSTAVTKTGDSTFKVTGELQLHGVKKTMTVDVEKVGSGKHPRSGKAIIGFESRLQIKRSDFGMNYMVGPLSDEIDLIISIEAGE